MKACRVSVPPTFGKAEIFTTDSDSFHGLPDPVTCPADRSRKSIAMYYYTAPREGVADIRKRTTDFRPRPKSSDNFSSAFIRGMKKIEDNWYPPILTRQLRKYFWRVYQ